MISIEFLAMSFDLCIQTTRREPQKHRLGKEHAEKTNHSMLFADLERYCHNRKKADTCATQAIYQQRKNALFTESANRVICKPADLPDLFGPKTEEP